MKKRTMRRRIRCAAPVRKEKLYQENLKQKEKYELEAKKAQVRSWKAFCEKQDRETLWDGIYRVVGRTMKRQEELPLIADGKYLNPKESAQLLAETFYPQDDRRTDNEEHRNIRQSADQEDDRGESEVLDPPFTLKEFETAKSSFKPKKAPGQDGLTADICQNAIDRNPSVFLALANKCLELGHFPGKWKAATVVALQKPGKDTYLHAKSYRPIGLLPMLGNILEKMVMTRLKWHVLARISTHQYGFMPQRSTEDALYVLMQRITQRLS